MGLQDLGLWSNEYLEWASAGESKAFTFRLSVGCLMALVGFGFYSYSKVSQQQQQSIAAVKGAKESPSKGSLQFDEEAQDRQGLLRPQSSHK